MAAAGRPDVLVVMARQPTPGEVKTRLARRMGAGAACALYVAFLRDLAASLSGGGWQVTWALTPVGADLRPIIGTAADCIAQRGPDLGARMAGAVDDCFARGAGRVVIIGADAPHLGPAAVTAAFAALATADVVLTPTRDGGYCLLGLREPRDLFRDVEMGTSRVFAQTMTRAAALGLRVVLQPETFDVDEWDDVERLRALIDAGTVDLPHTAAALSAAARAGA